MTRTATTISTRLLDRYPTSSSTTTTASSVPVAKPSANGSKRPTIIIYPTDEPPDGKWSPPPMNIRKTADGFPTDKQMVYTACRLAFQHCNRDTSKRVTPESIVVPIVSCIFGFPLLALTVICCLRRRAKLARERARRRNCELDRGELSVVRLSPARNRPRAVSLVRSPRAPPSLELDTVLEERSDPDQTTLSQVEITPDREVGAILFSAMGAVGAAAAYAHDS